MFKISAIFASVMAALFGYTITQQNETPERPQPVAVANQQPTNPTPDNGNNDASDQTGDATATVNDQDATNWQQDFTQCPDVQVNQKSKFTPYLQSMTPNSVSVSWKSEIDSGSIVEYSTSPCDFSNQNVKTASGSAKFMTLAYFYNTVKLQGLQPDQRYYYRVKSGKKVSGIYRFATAPRAGDNRKIRFLVFGDHQSALDDRYRMLVEAAKRKVEQKYDMPIEQSIDFVVNDGDQVQNGGIALEWQNLHFRQSASLSANVPIQMTVGNHEYWGDPDLRRYRAFSKAEDLDYAGIKGANDETYYAYQQGSTLLVHLNSNVDSHDKAKASREAQTQWLKEIINVAKNDDTVSFIVSVLHHPYRTETQKPASASLNDIWMDILGSTEKYAMNVSGHHHIYSRGQVVEKPVYHMISGGTGGALSAQWFGDPYSKFINGDDLQKTIANWTWQVVEIDPVDKTLTVESYAEGHPAVYNLTRKLPYNSRLIDTFTRKLGQLKPNKPTITGLSDNQQVDLSQDFEVSSSEFSSVLASAKLNSSQFQISADDSFHDLEVDKFTNFEDVFGDTGAPHYKPIDLHKDKNILKYTVKQQSLSNGTHYIRVRHRDRNVEWSNWSAPVAFNVVNSDKQPSESSHSHGAHGHSH